MKLIFRLFVFVLLPFCYVNITIAENCYYENDGTYTCSGNIDVSSENTNNNTNTNIVTGWSSGPMTGTCSTCEKSSSDPDPVVITSVRSIDPQHAATTQVITNTDNVKPYSGLKTCYDGTQIWEWENCQPSPTVITTTTAGSPGVSAPSFNGVVVFTSGYGYYGSTYNNPNVYQTTSWGTRSGSATGYAPVVNYSKPVVTNNNTYIPTVWGTKSGGSTYVPAPTYAQTPTTPPVPTVTNTNTYVPTVWGTRSSGGTIAAAPVYNQTPSLPTVSAETNANSYVPTVWGTKSSGGTGGAPAPVYVQPQVTSQQPVNNTSSTYVPTNWGTRSSGVIGSGPAPTYNQSQSYNQSNNNTNTSGSYVMTNWGSKSAASQTYTNTQTYNEYPIGCSNSNCTISSNNKVVTTAVTQLDINSARCNGVATIAKNLSTLGYFEYGESRDLGRVSQQANLGSLPSVSYSNLITNLRPDTVYYCRAVMSNSSGTYRGNIVSFKTKAQNNKVATVSSILQTTTVVRKEEVVSRVPVETVVNNKKVTVSKSVSNIVEKKAVVCMDESGNTTDLLEGEKFVTVEIRKPNSIKAGQRVEYIVHLYNKSKIDLKNAYIKLSIPDEYKYLGINGKVEDRDIVLNIGKIAAGETLDKTFEFLVSDTARIGQGIVSSAYVYYEMLGDDGKDISDENSGYVVATITGGEEVVEGDTFFGSTVFKWILVLVLAFILFILGRSIYKGVLHQRAKKKVLDAHH